MNSQQCLTMMVALKSGCQSDAQFWAAIAEMQQSVGSVASSDAEGSSVPAAAAAEKKRHGPLPLAERTPEQQAAHAAKQVAKKALKAAQAAVAEAANTLATPEETAALGWLAERAVEAAEAVSGASSDAEVPKKAKKPKKAAAAAEGGGGAPAAAEAPKEKRPPSAWNLLVTKTVSDMRQSGWQSWTDAKGVVWPSSKLVTVKGAEQHVYDGGEHDGKPPSPALGGMVRASWLKGKVVGLQGEWAEME